MHRTSIYHPKLTSPAKREFPGLVVVKAILGLASSSASSPYCPGYVNADLTLRMVFSPGNLKRRNSCVPFSNATWGTRVPDLRFTS